MAIRVRDVVRAAEFYRGVLELEPMAAPRPGVAWFRLGETILMIEPHETGDAIATSGAQSGLHLLALSISPDERAQWEARLHAHAVTITHRTDYTLYFCDPEGTRLALSHYPARSG